MDNKAHVTISKRQQSEKTSLLEQLRKTPIIQIACEKTGTSRATFYRWKGEDNEFSLAADDAIAEGTQLVSDMAESQLLVAIRDGNLGAIVFWLRNHHTGYTNKVEITARFKMEEKLTPEQEELIGQALELSSLIPGDSLTKTESGDKVHPAGEVDKKEGIEK